MALFAMGSFYLLPDHESPSNISRWLTWHRLNMRAICALAALDSSACQGRSCATLLRLASKAQGKFVLWSISFAAVLAFFGRYYLARPVANPAQVDGRVADYTHVANAPLRTSASTRVASVSIVSEGGKVARARDWRRKHFSNQQNLIARPSANKNLQRT